MIRNNVTRLLDNAKMPYTSHALPEEKLGALETAQFLKVEAARVFKSILFVREKPGKPILAIVPGDRKVDGKALAAALGEKKVRLTSQQEAEQLTGLQVGGISPLALQNRGFQVIFDDSVLTYQTIFISGGQRGLNIEIAPKDVVQLLKAKTGKITLPLESAG